MKKVSILAATLLATTMSYAQLSVDPEVGVNFSNIKTKVGSADASSTDAQLGIRAGAGVTIGLYKGLYLKPGVYYNMLGGSTENLATKTTTTLNYLEIPVNIGYQYSLSPKAGKVFAEVGPYVGYAFSGSNKIDIAGVETKSDIDFGDKISEMKPLDYGFKLGIGYETPWGVYVKGNYGMGLGNMSNVDDVTITNNTWNVSVGYRIQL